MSDLATVGINVVLQGQQQAIAGLNQVAAAADNKVSPAAKRVIENFQRTRQTMQQLERQTQTLNRSFTSLEIDRVAQRMGSLENVLNNTRQGMNGFGVITQQAGYQIGDFIVQVQSGTSAFVAFGQQATQMVGFLPMLAAEMNIAKVTFMGLSLSMATVTLGLSIIIPLVTAFGAAWMRTTEAADKSKSAMDSYQELLTSLNSKLVEVNTNLEAFRRGVEPDQIFETVLAIEDLVSTLETLRNTPVEGFMDAWTRGDRIAAAQALKVELEKTLELLKQQQEEEQRLETAATRRANEVRNQYREQFKEAERFKSKVSETLGVMESMARVSLSNAFTNAMPAAQSLLTTVTNLYNKAVGLAYINSNSPGGKSYLANQYALYGQGKEMGRQAVAESGSLYTPFHVPEEKTGGGSARRETEIRKQIDLTKELTQAEKDRLSIVRSVESSLEDGFMSMVDGTKSVTDSFKSMARDIIKELYRVLVVQRMVGAIAGAVNMASLPSTPSTGSFGLPDFRASGGSMMPGKPYVVGEHGPELVVPRHSGTVMNANQTANALGGDSGGFTQNLTISVTGSDASMVRAEVAKMIPQITNATKAAVIDAKQRGGQMAAAFR